MIDVCRKAAYGYDQRVEVLGLPPSLSLTKPESKPEPRPDPNPSPNPNPNPKPRPQP